MGEMKFVHPKTTGSGALGAMANHWAGSRYPATFGTRI